MDWAFGLAGIRRGLYLDLHQKPESYRHFPLDRHYPNDFFLGLFDISFSPSPPDHLTNARGDGPNLGGGPLRWIGPPLDGSNRYIIFFGLGAVFLWQKQGPPNEKTLKSFR